MAAPSIKLVDRATPFRLSQFLSRLQECRRQLMQLIDKAKSAKDAMELLARQYGFEGCLVRKESYAPLLLRGMEKDLADLEVSMTLQCP